MSQEKNQVVPASSVDDGSDKNQNKQKKDKHNPIAAIEKFVEVQSKEIELKSKEIEFKTQELEVRRQEIESNKEIALKSIDAQKEDRETQTKYFSGLESKKVYFKCLIALGVVAVVIISMFTDNAQYTIELAKIGGGVLAGYLAGVYKGKSDQLERTPPPKTED